MDAARQAEKICFFGKLDTLRAAEGWRDLCARVRVRCAPHLQAQCSGSRRPFASSRPLSWATFCAQARPPGSLPAGFTLKGSLQSVYARVGASPLESPVQQWHTTSKVTGSDTGDANWRLGPCSWLHRNRPADEIAAACPSGAKVRTCEGRRLACACARPPRKTRSLHPISRRVRLELSWITPTKRPAHKPTIQDSRQGPFCGREVSAV